jgi:RNA polymerase subunit RPABC4/transcription elongation factor Spt4
MIYYKCGDCGVIFKTGYKKPKVCPACGSLKFESFYYFGMMRGFNKGVGIIAPKQK